MTSINIRERIRSQMALAQAELRQHEAAQQNAASGILQCMGAIRGLEMLLADLEKDEVALAANDAAHKHMPEYVPDSDVDYQG
jgi:hypothetical protein